MNKVDTFEFFTVLAIIGMIVWNITDYFGGMILYLLMYWYVILPLFLFYVYSLVKLMLKISNTGISKNKIIFTSHIAFLLFFISIKVIDSDLIKEKRVLTATMKDDLAHYTLVLREDGSCENNIVGFLGFKEKYEGLYHTKGDTLIFSKKPYDNNFIPDTLLIDRSQEAIFLSRTKTGEFSKEKQWLNHFEIRNEIY